MCVRERWKSRRLKHGSVTYMDSARDLKINLNEALRIPALLGIEIRGYTKNAFGVRGLMLFERR